MSAISGTGLDAATNGYGTLARVISDSAGTKAQLDKLAAQTSSGRVANTYSGLGSAAATSLVLAPVSAHQAIWMSNIDAAAGRLAATQTALSQINSIATDFYARTNTLNGLNASTIDSVAAAAGDALRQVAGLLNTRSGDIYVFAGQDSRNPPVPDSDQIASSTFAADIAGAVANLDVNGSAATIAATMITASSNVAGTSPFSASLSQPASLLTVQRSTVQLDNDSMIPTGILASANGDVASTGSATTGSYSRDILRGLATLAGLGSSQAASSNLAALVEDVRTSLGGAITALNADAGVMGDRQAALQTTHSRLGDVTTALDAQLAGAEQVDMTATLSRLTQVQTQLQASYQLIATLQSLSLTKFL